MNRNMRLTLVLAGLAGARFGLGVWVLYYLLFTDFAGIGLLEALTIVTALVMEVPSGMLADSIGRRKTLVIAFALSAAAYLILASSRHVWDLALGILVFTLGRAMISGAFEALVSDSIPHEHLEQGFERAIANRYAVRLAVLAVTCAVGGYLYEMDPRAPFLASAIAFAIGIPVALGLNENMPRKILHVSPPTPSAGSEMGEFLKRITISGILAFVMVAGMLFLVAEEILDDVLAVHFGLQPTQLGHFFAGVYLVAALAAKFGPRVAQKFSVGRFLLFIYTLVALSLFVSPWLGTVTGCALIVWRYGARAVVANIEAKLVNAMAPHDRRATYFSMWTMIKSLPYVCLAYMIGSVIDHRGADFVGFILGGLMLLCTVFGWVFITRTDA